MAALALLALLALLPPPLIGSSGSAVGGASSSALCDTALDSVCGSVRGAGSACTSCQTTFSHQVILHGAGCAPADLTGFCEWTQIQWLRMLNLHSNSLRIARQMRD